MSESKQRIPSLPREQWTNEIHDLMAMVGEPGASYNFTHWFVNHPALARNWLVYNRFLADGELPATLREIVILRIAFLNESEFEWVEHVDIGRWVGLGDEHFEAVKEGADASIWSDTERLCLRAADQLSRTNDIDDELWSRLSAALETRQLMELVFVAGTYTLMAWVLRTFRLPLEKKPNPAK